MRFYLKTILTIILVLLTIISCSKAEDGIDGFNSIISTEIELSGINCQAGGIRVSTGLDLNRNNILEQNEIENTDYICNGDGGIIELDNLVRLELGSPNVMSCGTNWYISEFDTFHFPDFNKSDYSNVSSILFVPSMISQPGNNIIIELYNITDNESIINSQLTHNTDEYVFKYSEDIYNNLPNHTITLGIRMKNSTPNGCGGLGVKSYLYILRE
ncbi:hypothetical protein ULMS_29630 [Patiriisocius marinistellae]|uniref:DUF7151 domain-containing protein n=1 Tax=Patiriisocius marinistellae TaxID=2494560 RepID=A0A5J4G3N2_9FLAO|nr:hypothetical protein [Patiriisocius marinistellae]GEQ87455.1 hypothetical protein ULMS_29630 [Patiriisocius marinistellae]